MTISVTPIARSAFRGSKPLVTLQARYPRMIHAEVKTHRLLRVDDVEIEFLEEISLMDDENLSRNASSSRAVPIERMIREALEDPAMPVRWGSAKAGMQDGGTHEEPVVIKTFEEEMHGSFIEGSMTFTSEEAWLWARDQAVKAARGFLAAGYHKQVANRLLEPFTHISVVITATEWDNFLNLRLHEAADPTMWALASAVAHALGESERLANSTWHLPYLVADDWEWARKAGKDFEDLAMISAARCARVSYLNHDGSNPDRKKDLQLANKLRELRHMSPFEHQAFSPYGDTLPELSGNLKGWHQFRRVIETERSARILA